MAQVRFLDQVPVSAYAVTSTATGGNSGRLPRILQSGETLIIQPNQQLVGFELYVLEGALVVIQGGEQVPGTDLYTHGLLQLETLLENEGTIINDGYLVLGTELQ